MTPEAIVATAIREGLEVVAITDHNSHAGIRRALAAADPRKLLVLPGIEVSTSQGHLLLYFPTVEALETAFGRLKFSVERDYCTQSFEDCLSIAVESGGLGIAAHIEADAGFMVRIPGNSPMKGGALSHPGLAALELAGAGARDFFTTDDPDRARAEQAAARRAKLGTAEDLPKVVSSDAHTLSKLGHNAAGAQRMTRLKMDALTFDAFRIALLEGSARCRLEEDLPVSIPTVLGVAFTGGFLDGQAIHFSPNLTCVIGGRGSGKSTTLEGVRAAAGDEPRSGIVDSEVWPDTIKLWYRDELGDVQEFVRHRGARTFNATRNDGLSSVSIESYGQGETAETIQHCGKDPGILLTFLDRFTHVHGELTRAEEGARLLRDSHVEISRLAREVESLPRYKQLKVDADTKLKLLEKEQAAEVVKLEGALAQERVYFEELDALLRALVPPSAAEVPEFFEYVRGLSEVQAVAGAEALKEIGAVATRFESGIASRHIDWRAAVTAFIKEVRVHMDAWKTRETAERDKIDKKRRELAEAGVKLDMDFIRKVTQSAAEFDKRIRELMLKSETLKTARAKRKKLVESYLAARSDAHAKRAATASRLSKNLSGDAEFQVTLRYREGAFSPAAQEIVTQAMQWRTSRVPRAQMLVEQLGVPALLRALDGGDATRFAAVVDETKTPLFSQSDQQQLLEQLRSPDVLAALQACEFHDLPAITIRGEAVLPGGARKPTHRDFSRLSLGQQQAVILSMLLYSDSTAPLVIDQPEDNLDGLFVAGVLVPHLRKIKERRQVIIVTHNANIAVLADSELIIPLRATNERSAISDRGSIDVKATQGHLCRILEGGDRAFLRRARIYGVAP